MSVQYSNFESVLFPDYTHIELPDNRVSRARKLDDAFVAWVFFPG